jgi:hypothetical protein
MNGHKEIADYADETELLRAMNRLVNPEARTVYFLTGHGERDINASGTTGMSRALETLQNKNYTVKTLNLMAETASPRMRVRSSSPGQPSRCRLLKLAS